MSSLDGSASQREQRRERHDGAKTVVNTGGPSRLRNKRQEKIVSMVHGYDSILTLSTALAALFLLWVLPALGLLAVGLLGLRIGDGANSESLDTFNSALGVVQGAQSLLGIVTGMMFVYWAFRARENVRRLGKRHRIGVVDILLRRAKALIVAILAVVVAFFVPVASIVIVAFVILAGALIYISFTVHSITYATMDMLWRTSSPPIGLENAMPHAGLAWIWSWGLYAATIGLTQNPSQNPDVWALSPSAIGMIAVLEGIVLLIAVTCAARLVMGVAIRQEERLDAIVSYIENDGLDTDESNTVTTDQIQSAWDDSDRFVSFNS